MDRININEKNYGLNTNDSISSDVYILDLKNEILELKKTTIKAEEFSHNLMHENLELKKQIIGLEQINLNLMIENKKLNSESFRNRDLNYQIKFNPELNENMDYSLHSKNNSIDFVYIKKTSTLEFDCYISSLLLLSDNKYACFSLDGIKILELKNNRLEFIDIINLKNTDINPILLENQNFIFSDSSNLNICDKNFKLIQNIPEQNIKSICSLSELSFAAKMDVTVKIYSINQDTQKYHKTNEYKLTCVNPCMLYLPTKNYLLLGGNSGQIEVFNLTDNISIKKFTGLHTKGICSLIRLEDDKFASSSSDGTIKVWWVKSDIQPIKTIKIFDYDERSYNNSLNINLLGNDLILCITRNGMEIWNWKTSQYLITYKECPSKIYLTSEKNMISINGKKVDYWKIKY